MEDVDTVLRVYHSGVTSGVLELGDRDMFDRLLKKHRDSSVPPVAITNGDSPVAA